MNKPLRILLMIGSLREGGSEAQVVMLMRGLRAEGHTVALMLLHYEGGRLEEVLHEGFDVYPVRLPRFRPLWNPFPWMRLPFTLLRSISYIRSFRPDVLHAWLFWAHLWARLCLLFLPRIPFVTSRRETPKYEGKRNQWQLRVENWINCRVGAIVTNSREIKQRVQNNESLCSPIVLVRNGVEFDRIDAAPVSNLRQVFPKLEPADTIAIIVASLLPAKGYPYLIRAWKQIIAQHPRAMLLCVGADGGLGSELAQLTKQLGLTDHVHFVGARNDIPSLVKGADLAILSSVNEGLSNSLLEYMAMGKAVVCTDIPGSREVVSPGKNAIVVASANPDALAEGICRALTTDEMRKDFGAHASASVRRRFDRDLMVRRMVNVYRFVRLRYIRR